MSTALSVHTAAHELPDPPHAARLELPPRRFDQRLQVRKDPAVDLGPLAGRRLLPVWLRGLIRATRPRQWVKNGFVFIPLFFEVPAFLYVGLWFVLNLLQGTAELFALSGGAGVAWWAHIGGFVVGFVLGPWLRRSEQNYRPYYADEGVLGFDPSGRP